MAPLSASLWISELLCSPRTAVKINVKHGLDLETVRQHVVGQWGLRGRRLADPDDLLKYALEISMDGRRVVVVVLATDEPTTFVLKTAYSADR